MTSASASRALRKSKSTAAVDAGRGSYSRVAESGMTRFGISPTQHIGVYVSRSNSGLGRTMRTSGEVAFTAARVTSRSMRYFPDGHGAMRSSCPSQ